VDLTTQRSEPDDVAGGETSADELTELLLGSIRAAVGAGVITAAMVSDIVRRTTGHVPTAPPDGTPAPLAAVAMGAALGAMITGASRGAVVVRRAWTALGWSAWLVPAPAMPDGVRRAVERWDARWQATAQGSEVASAAFTRALVPAVIDAVLDRIDLTSLIRERVDVDALVAEIDLDAAVVTLDVDRIVERVDLDAVAARIDPNAIADRVDLERIVERIDVTGIAREVIDELDLPALIRTSSETVTSEAVDDLRLGAVDADRAVARMVDRILRRHAQRAIDSDVVHGSTP
jgi:hypothetical protein